MQEEQRVQRAKAFAWRAIGCAVWLGIAIAILVIAAIVRVIFVKLSTPYPFPFMSP